MTVIDDALGWRLTRHTEVTTAVSDEFTALVRSTPSDAGPHPFAVVRPLSELFIASYESILGQAPRAEGLLHTYQRLSFVRRFDTGPLTAALEIVEVGTLGLHVGCRCEATVSDADGPVATATTVLSIPGQSSGRKMALPTRKRTSGVGTALGTVAVSVSADEVRRYAATSGDHNPIHVDEEFARSVGLRGSIVHGMFAFALAVSTAAGASGAPIDRVASAATRFSRPWYPGEELAVTSVLVEPRRIAVDARVGDGRVLRDTTVELA